MVHTPGFPVALAAERAQTAAVARAPVTIYRLAAAAEPGVARHDAPGRPESELVAEPQQRERPLSGRPPARASPKSWGAEHTAKPKLEERQGGGLGVVRRRDQEAERGGAESEGGRGATQGGQLTVRAYGFL